MGIIWLNLCISKQLKGYLDMEQLLVLEVFFFLASLPIAQTTIYFFFSTVKVQIVFLLALNPYGTCVSAPTLAVETMNMFNLVRFKCMLFFLVC